MPKEKPFRVSEWNHILIEGYCMINIDVDSKRSKYVYEWNTKTNKKTKKKNPSYDPTIKPDYPPPGCNGYVCMDCLSINDEKCKHFAYSNVEMGLKLRFHKMIRKYMKVK